MFVTNRQCLPKIEKDIKTGLQVMTTIAATNGGFNVMRAALRGEWNDIINFYNLQQVEPSCNNFDLENDNTKVLVCNVTGDTILHMCVQYRRTDVMKQLLRIMPEAKELLSRVNRMGNTILHEAARTGIVEMATLILEKELDSGGDQVLISVPNLNGETPIYWAAMYGHKDMLLFLNTTASNRGITSTSTTTSMVSPLTTRSIDGSTILHAAVLAKAYDVAMEIMEIYSNLDSNKNGDGATASHILALSPTSFKSGTIYGEQYLGATPIVLAKKAAAIVYSLIPIENYETRNRTNHKTQQPDSSLKEKFKQYFRLLCKGFPVLKLIYNAKQQHTYAIQLLRKLLEKDYGQWTMSYDPPHGWDGSHNKSHENRHPLSAIATRVITYKVRERPIILATKLGIVEMFKEIINAYPESIGVCDEEAGRNLLHLAAEYRHESIVEFLKSSSTNSKRNLDMLVVGIDREGNTPLHAAAKLGKHKPWHIRGAAQWMQWECVWFQRVKRMLPPAMLTVKNCNEKYAHQVFTETHIDLREQGEIWLKEGSNNCMLISALIATVMFACAFTVPGGNDSTSGRPLLLKNQDFGPFFHYVSYSLFFSLISLGLFLSIHAAPFNEHDFFFRLPLRSVFAITALFNSVTFIACAYFQTYMLVTAWTFPVGFLILDIGLASLGVLFFVELYVDSVVGFIRYLLDILFI